MLTMTVCGNVTKDTELRTVKTVKGDMTVCAVDIASNHGYGENKKTTYFRGTIWGERAKSLAPYLTKGQKVLVVTDEITARAYSTKDKEPAASLEFIIRDIELLGSKKSEGEAEKPVKVAAKKEYKAPEKTEDEESEEVPW